MYYSTQRVSLVAFSTTLSLEESLALRHGSSKSLKGTLSWSLTVR